MVDGASTVAGDADDMGFGAVYLCVPTLGGGIVWVGRKRKSEKDCYN